MNYEEKIAKLEAARAAVEAAKAACEAAGVAATLDDLAAKIDAARASVEHRQRPVDIGDWILVADGRGWSRWKLEAARAKWLTIGGAQFDRERGQMKGGTGYGRWIHSDDLARINRDIPPKRGAR